MDKLTKEQTVEFVTAKECHICFKKFSPKDRKVSSGGYQLLNVRKVQKSA